MHRLTARSQKNNMAYLVNVKPNEQDVESPYPNTLKCIMEAFERLAQYEDKFEQLPNVVTEEPNGNIESMRNMVYIKNKEVYLRGLGEDDKDVKLVDYCESENKRLYGTEIEADTSEFGDYMDDDSLLSLFYWACVGFAEVREILKQYEDLNAK